MAIKVRVDPIDRDIEFMIASSLSPEARSKMFAEAAAEEIQSAKAQNAQVMGREPTVTITVDGNKGAPLSSVKPDGVIIADFNVGTDAILWIAEQLVRHSPRKTGRYRQSHVFTVDGDAMAPGIAVPAAKDEYAFINIQPYARKIERGLSSQSPEGVYQAVATLAQAKFVDAAKITFAYRAPTFGAVNTWAGTPSAQRHAAAHGRRIDAAEWLRNQPAIIIKLY